MRQAGVVRVQVVAGLDQFALGVVLRGEDHAVLHVAVGRHQDDQHAPLAQAQELDVVEHAGLARRGDHADEARQAGQQMRRLRDHTLRLVGVQLLARRHHVSRRVGQAHRPRSEHGVDKEAVAPRRGHAPGRGMRAGDQAHLLEVGHNVADGGRRKLQPRRTRQGSRTYRLAVGDVAFDQGLEQGSCALVQHGFHCTDMPRADAWRMGPMV